MHSIFQDQVLTLTHLEGCGILSQISGDRRKLETVKYIYLYSR